MERPVFAPRGDPTGRNQGLERPVPARRQRAHAPPESVICCIIVFTGTLVKPATIIPLTPDPILATQARPDPNRQLLRNLLRNETLRVRVRVLLHRPRRQAPPHQHHQHHHALAHKTAFCLPACTPPRPSGHRSPHQAGRGRRWRCEPRRLAGRRGRPTSHLCPLRLLASHRAICQNSI
jgi:hypothetical protein